MIRPAELMSTREVAEYLRVKERKIYELVAARAIPCTRVTGKWLFPRTLIDLWVIGNCRHDSLVVPPVPSAPVIAGSHDPLLEWAVRESGCELALLGGGSLDGLTRMASRQALACGLHVLDPDKGRYNVDLVARTLEGFPVVLVEWAWRRQGLIVASGNPLGLTGLADVVRQRVRFVDRQPEAGSHLLLAHLLAALDRSPADLDIPLPPARNETDLALTVLDGKADAGLGIEAVARQFRLGFVPLHRERFDLLVVRRDWFEPPMQKLLAFARAPRFADKARELGGYEVAGLGTVIYNGP